MVESVDIQAEEGGFCAFFSVFEVLKRFKQCVLCVLCQCDSKNQC